MRSLALGLVVLMLLAGPAAAKQDDGDQSAHALQPLIAELRAQQKVLAKRARLLDDREAQVSSLEAAVETRLAELEELARTVATRVAHAESGGSNVRRLAKIYASMPPARAAALIKDLDVDLATQIVAKMKDKQSAAVMALLPKERALIMSQKVAHPLAMQPAVPAKGAR